MSNVFNAVWEELTNNEVQYGFDVQDITDTLQLRGYGVSIEEVKEIYGLYMVNAYENDLI